MKNILLPALTLLYCLNGFAQEIANATEKKEILKNSTPIQTP